MRILVTGAFSNYCLETSFKNGFQENGHEVLAFDIKKAIARYTRLGKFGTVLNSFLPVEPWIHKANRELVILAKEFQPDIVICAANNEVHAGTLAFIKSVTPAKIVLIWPDTLFNLGKNVLLCAPFYDLVVAHSKAAIKIFKDYGFKRAEWLPFAGDLQAHLGKVFATKDFKYDLTFVGANRPEREKVIAYIIQKFPTLRIKVWGPYWNRTNNKAIRQIADPSPLYGKDFVDVVQSSLINLNIIDDTNFPGSNMRFFEIPTAGGLQLCSSCPEMEDTYMDGQYLYYYHNDSELGEKINLITERKEMAWEVSNNFHQRIIEQDNYKIRSQQLIEILNR